MTLQPEVLLSGEKSDDPNEPHFPVPPNTLRFHDPQSQSQLCRSEGSISQPDADADTSASSGSFLSSSSCESDTKAGDKDKKYLSRAEREPADNVPHVIRKIREREMSLLGFLKAELTRGYSLELDEDRLTARREKVYTFFQVPFEVEKLMGYGFFQCADAFLFLFTFLPLRCSITIYKFIIKSFQNLLKNTLTVGGMKTSFKPADKCDLLKLLIFFACLYLFSYIDVSVIYHNVKSQSVIKLYIFFNMLEVGDRLLTCFVQDTLDALFLTATEPPEKKSWGTLPHTLLAIVGIFLHAVCILLQGTTLNVAINASDPALYTVMISNNFVELKGAVFKKFDKINLFQISCSDVRERFHLFILLLIVTVQTMREYSWENARFWILFQDSIIVLIVELGVDWLKHAFITRFNEIPPEVYKEYTLSMAYDLVQTKQRRAFSDHSDMVGRRLGFVPLPLAVVLIRVVCPSLMEIPLSNFILIFVAFLSLGLFRVLICIVLLGKACDLIDQHCTNITIMHSQTPAEGPQKSIKTIQELADEAQARFRSATSQPTTRTPSPTRGNMYNAGDGDILINRTEDSNRINSCPVKPRQKKSESKVFRSLSVSHTPRPSIVSETCALPSLGELPALPDESSTLLMANSAVSILSVGLNEEMLRATKRYNSESSNKDEAEPSGKHQRKHSLGSNVENEFTYQKETEVEREPSIPENAYPSAVLPTQNNLEVNDLDSTLVANTDSENKEIFTGEEKPCIETDSTIKKAKKKGLGWFLSH